jgi:hypothetical protein
LQCVSKGYFVIFAPPWARKIPWIKTQTSAFHFNLKHMAYIEPAPLVDKENPFEAMMSRFKVASQVLGLDEEVEVACQAGDCFLTGNDG